MDEIIHEASNSFSFLSMCSTGLKWVFENMWPACSYVLSCTIYYIYSFSLSVLSWTFNSILSVIEWIFIKISYPLSWLVDHIYSFSFSVLSWTSSSIFSTIEWIFIKLSSFSFKGTMGLLSNIFSLIIFSYMNIRKIPFIQIKNDEYICMYFINSLLISTNQLSTNNILSIMINTFSFLQFMLAILAIICLPNGMESENKKGKPQNIPQKIFIFISSLQITFLLVMTMNCLKWLHTDLVSVLIGIFIYILTIVSIYFSNIFMIKIF